MRLLAWIGVSVFSLTLSAPLSLAQVLNGRLEIVVQDSSSASIVNARITLRDMRKQAPVGGVVSTDTTGAALFASLPPSEYEITVEATGFRKAVVSGIELNASQTLRQLIALEVGSITESISIEATAAIVNTSDATIARTINLKAIDTLPALGRNPLAFVSLSAGVSIDPGDASFSRINGARQGSNNTRLDGIDANDAVVPRLGLSLTAVNTDSLEEVRLITNGGKAEYGRNAGGQVEMVTRSGANQYHGNVFEFLRNTVFNANPFFNNASGTPRPVFIQNIYGGSIGGKILKDKLFFYANYQGRRTTQGVVRNRTVLTPEAKQGIYRWPGGSFNIPAADPAGRGIDPKMKDIMALLPAPNNTDVGDGFNTAGYRFNVPAPSREEQGTGKVDYNMTANHRIFFRYSRQWNQSIDSLNNAEQRYPGQPDGAQGGARWGYGMGSDWTLSPSLINEFRLGYQSATVDFIRPYRDSGIAVLSNLFTDPMNSALGQGRNSPVIDITDNVTLLKGKHTFKTGFNFKRVLQYGYNYGGVYPNVDLTRTAAGNSVPATVGPQNLTSAQRQVFDGLFNDVLGRTGTISQTFYSNLQTFQDGGTPRVRNTVFRDLGLFFQDDFKLARNLVLNVGVRWEYYGPPVERDGLQGSLDKVGSINSIANIDGFTVQRTNTWFNKDWNNFAPRFGFAWNVGGDGKTVVRGNWGVFYDRIIGATSSSVDGNTPGFAQSTQTFPNSGATTVRTVNTLAAADFPAKPAAPVTNQPVTRVPTVTVFNPNLRTGYLQQINLGVQRQLTSNTVLDVSFVRSLGTKLFGFLDLNQPRIYGDFLNSFKELEAFRANGTPVSAGNTISRMFGGPQAAITALGATNFQQGLAGTVADNIDRNNFARYAAAGVSPFYLRNFPQYNQVQYGDNVGSSSYNSLQLSLTHKGRHSVMNVNYTYSRSIDNGSTDGNGFTAPVDNFNLVNNRGRTDADRPHVLNLVGSYSLPFGRKQRFLSDANGFVDRVIGGWEIGAVAVVQSGSVFSVTSARRTLGSTLNTYANYSGDRTIGEVVKVGNGVQYFTPEQVARFTYPGPGEIGTSGRNSFRGPGFFNMDISIVKRIPITERLRLTYRAEMYNALNKANFSTPGNSILTPTTFGRISSVVNASSGTGARVAQMALRIDF
ncbi:MAG: TonB-dependent receptor [Acidobacteria bacterium]|nr:TonB-dependent receptor [Acidobacteriota bacterium]